MKPFSWMMALVLLCSTQMAIADCGNFCDPCDPCSEMSYSVYADYLYWKVGRSGLNTDDDEHACPHYNSGFRVGGALHCDCWDFGARYTWFETSASEYNLHHWHRLDLETGYSWRLDCADVSFRPFAGAILVWADETFDGDDLDYRGYGLYVGSEAEWHLVNYCDTDVALVTRGAFGILDGRFKLEENDNAKECIFNSYLEVFAGLKLTMGDLCGCYSPELLIGYEVQHFGSWRETGSTNDVASLGFGGLVVRAGLSF